MNQRKVELFNTAATEHTAVRFSVAIPAPRLLLSILLVLLVACAPDEESADGTSPEPTPQQNLIITLGDIDPDQPADRVKRIHPLADHLAERLASHGYGKGNVIIARDIDEMARLLREGRVDIYLDTIFPTLSVRKHAGTRVILRRAVKGDLDYWSMFITQRSGGLASLDDLGGKVVAFQEAYSTSGYFLPAGILRQRGIELVEVGASDAAIADHQTGYVFTRDEENTLTMVLDGVVDLGAISNQDYESLTHNMKEQLAVVERTLAVPRTLVSARAGLRDELVEEIRRILLELRGESLSEEEDAWTWSFAELSTQSEEALVTVEALMELDVEVE